MTWLVSRNPTQRNLTKGRRTEKSGTEKCRPAQLPIFLSQIFLFAGLILPADLVAIPPREPCSAPAGIKPAYS
jgi:hypothetical protein